MCFQSKASGYSYGCILENQVNYKSKTRQHLHTHKKRTKHNAKRKPLNHRRKKKKELQNQLKNKV